MYLNYYFILFGNDEFLLTIILVYFEKLIMNILYRILLFWLSSFILIVFSLLVKLFESFINYWQKTSLIEDIKLKLVELPFIWKFPIL